MRAHPGQGAGHPRLLRAHELSVSPPRPRLTCWARLLGSLAGLACSVSAVGIEAGLLRRVGGGGGGAAVWGSLVPGRPAVRRSRGRLLAHTAHPRPLALPARSFTTTKAHITVLGGVVEELVKDAGLEVGGRAWRGAAARRGSVGAGVRRWRRLRMPAAMLPCAATLLAHCGGAPEGSALRVRRATRHAPPAASPPPHRPAPNRPPGHQHQPLQGRHGLRQAGRLHPEVGQRQDRVRSSGGGARAAK